MTRFHSDWVSVREALRTNLAARFPSLLPFLGCRPLAANLRLTHRCSGRCRTCTHWKYKGDNYPELSTQTWKAILRQLRDQNVLKVSFTGGDILLREDTPELMANAKGLGLHVRATLNGYSITERIAQDIMTAHPDDLSLSLDHLNGFFADTRGVPDATGKVLQALHLLRKHNTGNTRLGLAVTLMKGSLEGSERVIRFALTNDLFVNFNLIHFTHYFSNTAFSREQYHLSRKESLDLRQLVNRLIDLHRSHPKLLPPPSHLRWMVSYFNDYRQPLTPCHKTMLKPCIDPDGSIRACCSMDPVGNITQKPLNEIVSSPDYLQAVSLGLSKTCPGCSCHFSLNLGANLANRFRLHINKNKDREIQRKKRPNASASSFIELRHVKVAGELMCEAALTLSNRLRPTPAAPITFCSHPTIVFQAYSVHLAQFFYAVAHELRVRGVNIGFQILHHPHFPRAESRALRRYVIEQLAIHPGRITTYPKIPTDRIDLLVCADVYARFPRQTCQTCIIFHGPALQRRNFKRLPFRKTLYQFDKAIVSGSYDLRLIEKYRGRHRKGFEAVVGGFPFIDALATPALSKMVYYQKLGLDLDKPTILIGPNWGGLRLAQNRGTFYLEEVLKALGNIHANLLLKLHSCSYNTFMAGGVDWAGKIKRLVSQGLVRVDPDLDDKNSMAHSDILITDMSSRAFIFMLLEKPVIQYFPVSGSWDQWEGPRQELIKKGALVAKTAADIPKLLLQAQRGGFHRPHARKIADDCIARFGHATDFVADRLLKWSQDTSESKLPLHRI